MTTIHRRVTRSGDRFDVAFSDNGRSRSRTFTTLGEARRFAQARDLRWELQPLLDHAGLDPAGFAHIHGFPVTAVANAAAHGLTDTRADRWAVAAGHHPVTVWGWPWIQAALDGNETAPDKASTR